MAAETAQANVVAHLHTLEIDYEALETGYPYFVNDFPHGGGRYIVESQGYVATIVGGQPIVENGRHTGKRPGHVIRDFARD